MSTISRQSWWNNVKRHSRTDWVLKVCRCAFLRSLMVEATFLLEKNKSDMKGLCPGLTHVERIPQDRPWEHLFGKHCSIRQREGILTTGMNTLVNMHADVISFQTCSYGYKVDSDLNTKVGHQLCQWLLLLVG